MPKTIWLWFVSSRAMGTKLPVDSAWSLMKAVYIHWLLIWLIAGVLCTTGELSRAAVDKGAASQPTQEAQNLENGTCLGCHGTEGFSVPAADGRARDLHINKDKLAVSKHGELPCVMCHQAITSIPHPESARVAKVD